MSRYKDSYYTWPKLLFKPHQVHARMQDKLTNIRVFKGFFPALKEMYKTVRSWPRDKWLWQKLHDRIIGTRIL